jgi:hypothetical protein
VFLRGRLAAATLFSRPAPDHVSAALRWLFRLVEQAPELGTERLRRNLAPLWNGLQSLTGRLEADLGPGAMVFQLPVRQFPEAGPMNRMLDYEHFQPFLADSSLRFSYGPLAHSREFGWQQFVSRLPAAEMVAALEASGFSAVWVNVWAYSDGGNRIVRELLALGRTEIDRQLARCSASFACVPPRQRGPTWTTSASITPGDPAPAAGGVAAGGQRLVPLEQDGARRWRYAKRRDRDLWLLEPAAGRVRFKAAVLYDNVLELRQADWIPSSPRQGRGPERRAAASLAPQQPDPVDDPQRPGLPAPRDTRATRLPDRGSNSAGRRPGADHPRPAAGNFCQMPAGGFRSSLSHACHLRPAKPGGAFRFCFNRPEGLCSTSSPRTCLGKEIGSSACRRSTANCNSCPRRIPAAPAGPRPETALPGLPAPRRPDRDLPRRRGRSS